MRKQITLALLALGISGPDSKGNIQDPKNLLLPGSS